MEAYAFLFTVASIAGMSTIVDFFTSNILNEMLADPLVRMPINAALVSALLKFVLVKSSQRQNLEEDEDEDKEEDGVGGGDDGGRSGS